jgi:hypothetical protein
MTQRPSFPPEVLEALKRGNKLEAIKLLRAAAKVGLAEAKTVVDAIQAGNAPPPATPPAAKRPNVGLAHKHHALNPNLVRRPGLSPGEVPRSGDGMGWVVVLAGGLMLAWFFLR